MKTATKVLGSLAVAGVVAVGGSAFTAGGLKSTAGDDVALGGTITQTVSGELTVTGINYDYATDNTGNVTGMTVNFDAAPGTRAVTATFNGQAAVVCTHAAADLAALCAPAAPLDLQAVTVTVA